jgi:hypothetical protein
MEVLISESEGVIRITDDSVYPVGFKGAIQMTDPIGNVYGGLALAVAQLDDSIRLLEFALTSIQGTFIQGNYTIIQQNYDYGVAANRQVQMTATYIVPDINPIIQVEEDLITPNIKVKDIATYRSTIHSGFSTNIVWEVKIPSLNIAFRTLSINPSLSYNGGIYDALYTITAFVTNQYTSSNLTIITERQSTLGLDVFTPESLAQIEANIYNLHAWVDAIRYTNDTEYRRRQAVYENYYTMSGLLKMKIDAKDGLMLIYLKIN